MVIRAQPDQVISKSPSPLTCTVCASARRDENTLLLDVRNHRECVIGGFDGSLDPLTKTFADFPVWVRKHKDMLENKKVWKGISLLGSSKKGVMFGTCRLEGNRWFGCCTLSSNATRLGFHFGQVLMYCTGGIRCEKASAYIRELDVAADVKVC